MKKMLFVLFAVIFSVTMFADDVIVTKDSQRINAQIQEVGLDVVKYHRSDNLNGPLYTLSKKDIVTILYENGTVETFTSKESSKSTANSVPLTLYGNDILQDGKLLSRYEYVNLLRSQCPTAYNTYKNGVVLYNTGWGFFAAGVAITCASIAVLVEGDESIGFGLLYTGVASLSTSVPLLCVGVHRQKKSVDIYNHSCASEITYNITAGKNGIGLAINF